MLNLTPIQALRILALTADNAEESGHTEAEVIAGNWDILGPMIRNTLAQYDKEEEGL